ncbi:MAG TPA: hypothetical protein VLM38_01170 [Blastocatellia bacterium]|nr:hypothetical protein [Blastocatellia bacterium]
MENPEAPCFVIAPIGSPASAIRLRSDRILAQVIEPAVSQFNYKPFRADQVPAPGLITSEIIWHIANDPLVVADLTGHNPNVFYELALRHAVRKPVVQLIRAGESIPFDTAALGTIQVDDSDDERLKSASAELAEAIRGIHAARFRPETPVSVALRNWVFATAPGLVPRGVFESLIVNFAELTFLLEHDDDNGDFTIHRDVASMLSYILEDLDSISNALGLLSVSEQLPYWKSISATIRGEKR